MHKPFLLAALEQAWLGRGICAPNPAVGAVAVRNGEIIAQASHQGAGTLHAEQLLLEQLTGSLDDVTLYVTLEPCNHWGKTPPCVDAIVARGIKHVVYAHQDPNPVVAVNNTPALLSTKGIEVVHYPVAEVDAFYQSYRHWIKTQQPLVTVKMAQSLDGKIAGAGGARVLLSNAACHELTHRERLHTDVILTTARTINQDNPLLTARLPNRCVSKTIAVIDRKGQLNPHAAFWEHASQVHVFCDDHSEGLPREGCVTHPMPCLNNHLDLHAILKRLGQLGYHDVWVEAGGELFSALHRAHLVQRTCLYLVPLR
jgi:diaminohydroxyphosphoribosylaminopyrimidine deaminase/5-amino-6-(5-phosphoribosylamino)uracil reductase